MEDRRNLQLNRLRVLRKGGVVYDQRFHEGVNIIRGQNGSGKSTIADFIFFILGGEFNDWKDAASQCDEVQAEVETPSGKLTLQRSMKSKLSPVKVFFDEFNVANEQALEGWQRFPIRRNKGDESFSQVMFRSLRIPEAQSEGASNITMHQLLRLCYSDQRTPATRLFRYEPFDTQNIREAVGDLVCGISGYAIYEIGLELRDIQKELEGVNARLSGLLKALPPDDALRTTISIYTQMNDLKAEKDEIRREIDLVDEVISPGDVKEFLKERRQAQVHISKEREKIQRFESNSVSLEYEIREIADFQDYLSNLMEKLNNSESVKKAVGSIEFTYCPACGSELDVGSDNEHCVLCKTMTDPDDEKSHYNQIRLDLEIQFRESSQLLTQKETQLNSLKQQIRVMLNTHDREFSNYEMKFSGSNGPREAYLAEKTSRIGHIDAELEFLTKSLVIAGEVDGLNEKKSDLLQKLDRLKRRHVALHAQANKRRNNALSGISEAAVELLHADFKRQEEFEEAKKVELNFINDLISVDGHVNFAESSNVFLKNTAVLSVFLTAGNDSEFFHPRFLLLDNIEDKGMEMSRSHLFQKLIVEKATEIEMPFQVIFTTSMMNPELELEDYVIGPAYTKESKTLNL